MTFSRAALASLLAACTLASTEASFSYDMTSATGPTFWGDLAIAGNACSGDKNSPIDVVTSSCTDFADYQMTVSAMHKAMVCIIHCCILCLFSMFLLSIIHISERHLRLQ
jgi:carbonic anhydrase